MKLSSSVIEIMMTKKIMTTRKECGGGSGGGGTGADRCREGSSAATGGRRICEMAQFAYLAPFVKRDEKRKVRAYPNPAWGLGPGVLGPRRYPGSDRPMRPWGWRCRSPETRSGLGRARGRVWACPNRVAEAWEVGESLDILVAD